jgi:ABC-type branched-subunit amino acid transport system ATPase component/predicted MFS family arabinose efflux permease
VKILGLDLGELRPHKPRTPHQYFDQLTTGQALFPLIVLFGLNAVDELDRAAFGVLVPDIRDAFHQTDQGILTLIALTLLGGLLLEIPLAYYSDRLPRARIAVLGAAVWALFGIVTGLSVTIWMLWIARSGSGMGRAVVTPTHNSLLADYYPIEKRTDVYGFHRIGTAVGSFVGAFAGGVLAFWFGWRTPFFVFVVPTVIFVILGRRLREPLRGHYEREAAGANADAIATDEVPPSFAESVRILWQVRTLRRIWFSLPFLAVSIIGLVTLTSLYYDQVFHLNEAARGFIGAATEPAAVIGLSLGIPLASRMMLTDPGLGLRLLAIVGVFVSGMFLLFALTPYLWLAVSMNILISGVVSLLAPGIYASLSLCIPPKVRSLGYSMSSLFVVPGVLALELVGYVADHWGIRQGLLLMVPIFLIGAWTLASASLYVKSDISRVWTSTAAQAEVAFLRREGLAKLLLVRNLDVGYDGVQVLFHIDFEIDEGEIVALLGTNGAGKSTLLKAISGLVEATNGAIVFDGRDMTYAPPNEVAARGVVQVPGGAGVFPSLTVAENLRLAGWLHRKDRERTEDGIEHVLSLFPVLRERLGESAGNLSGGQQQMLTLGMAFLTRPRLLMIDELSLGLAPAVVEQLLPIVHEIRAQGTTIILVEQSVNLALTLAETAYFMEKGEIRFHGPTAELLSRPDVLRSVFLEGAATMTAPNGQPNGQPNGRPDAHAAPPRAVVGEVTANGETRNGHDTADAPPRLELREVSKSFGGLSALRDVDVKVGPGEIVGFLGPNGAGKTTLFDVISGFIAADTGTIVVGGRDITRLNAAARGRLGLGRSFQDGRLFPALTVAETVAVALERRVEVRDPIAAALHLPSVADSELHIRERVEQLLELLGITDFRDKLTRELSTGSRRVVDLACVLAHEPTVLLLDEPSSGIAQREAEALGPLLLRIRDETGASLLVIEHDVPLLLSIADRIVALDLGEVVTVGSPSEVVNDPRVVAAYLGTTEAAIARSGGALGTAVLQGTGVEAPAASHPPASQPNI